MPFATTNYGWTLPDAGAEPFSWEPFVRTAFQGIDTTMFSKFDKGGGTISGAVMIDTDGGGYSSTEPLFVGKAANAAVNAVVRNNNSGSAASAGVVVNAYGNSWRMAIGSAAKNGNKLTWEIDALGSPVERMSLTTDGTLLLGASTAASGEGYRFFRNYGRYDNGTFIGFIGAGDSLGGNATDFAIRSQYALTFMAGGGGTDMTLDASGNLLVGTSSGNHHTLSKAGASDYATTIINTSATSPYGQRIILSGVTGGTGAGFLSCQDDAERFRVLGNGNVQNINNSYGAISDANLKRDVTDTGPKLSKVLAMRIVNYYLKADPSNTKLLGMIAQELREISPGLVEENPDYEDVIVEPARTDTVTRQRQVVVSEEAVRYEVVEVEGQMRRLPIRTTVDVPQFTEHLLFDEAGQPIMEVVEPETPTTPAVLRQAVHRKPAMEDYTETVDVPAKIERRETGAVTLSIKYSILVPMLVKALQELHADFDQRLAALES
jgi:hypothetical protein